jgi:hypothetical protein
VGYHLREGQAFGVRGGHGRADEAAVRGKRES